MNKLKPCPFCGGYAKIYKSNEEPPMYNIKHTCMFDGRFGESTYQIYIDTNRKDTPEQAAELWNTRYKRGTE